MRQSPMQGSFNAGELSPRIEGRVDVPKYAQGMKTCENVIPLIQGPAMRRGGFRYAGTVQDSNERVWLVKFEFNVLQAYVLEFGPNYIAFWANEGQVFNGAIPYTISSPYGAADLTDANGQFNLRFTESADVVYIACGTQPPQTLSRLGPTNWVIAPFETVGGPFEDQIGVNTTTVQSSGQTGTVTLTASAPLFNEADVGTLFYLAQPTSFGTGVWTAGNTSSIGGLVTSNGKTYVAASSGTNGGDAPDHTSGTRPDGDPGVQWTYSDPGWGIVQITAVTDSQHAVGTVVPVSTQTATANIPFTATTSGLPSTNWRKAAWSSTNGYPSQVAFFSGRLAWARGVEVWLSVAGDFVNYSLQDLDAQVTDDMSIDITLQGQEVNNIQWMTPLTTSVSALICGCAGTEFSIAAASAASVFSPSNILAAPISYLGSKNSTPVLINHVLLFLQRAGRKLRDVSYDIFSQTYQSMDQTVLADHIMTPSTIVQIDYAQEPYSIIWGARADGQLVGMTYSREEYPEAPHGGWHRHRLGGGGAIQALCVIPSPDGTYDQLWAIVKRTVNGQVIQSVEFMNPPHQEGDDPEDSFYVDSGITFNNTISATLTPGAGADVDGQTGVVFQTDAAIFQATDVGRYIHYRYATQSTDVSGNPVNSFVTAKAIITGVTSSSQVTCTITNAFPNLLPIASNGWRMTVTTVTGLTWLAGQTVSILGDGAVIPPQTVSNAGVLTLPSPASKLQIGYACPAKWQTMRFNSGSTDGTAQGKLSQINRAVVRLWDTLGLQFGKSFADMDTINFRDPFDLMDTPVPLFTGDILLDVDSDWDRNPWLCFMQPDPLPAMIVAIMPQQSTNDYA
ncbi:hypothetical protein [Paraburkholderia fungorum]|uniref:hypothetical protein n=1 Tax=Paraburkholderia fungorum TaxID=134537 RepID=UPI001C1E9B84|nr:hypothetical protein [Paraburkholderia fungorum]MBU7436517.1 hypothetical protein [Paraburkholderia fungorum]